MLSTLPSLNSPALVNVLEYGFYPASFARRGARSCGRVYHMKGPSGDILVTTDPVHIRSLIAADYDAFESISSILPWLFGQRSVLVTWGATHKRQRKLISPGVNGARLKALGSTMAELAQARVNALKVGQEFKALDFTNAYTLDVILRTVFGVESETAEVRDIVQGVVNTAVPTLFFIPQLQRRWFPPWARYVKNRSRYDIWVKGQIASRRAAGGSGRDVLSLLLEARYEDGSGMDDEEIADQLIGLLLVGHETTAIGLASCLDRIHHHPGVLERLLEELKTVSEPDEIQRLPYLSAVLDETLRIDTVITDLTRIAKVPFRLDDSLVLEPGQMVMVLTEALHSDPELYPDPQEFRPERFMNRRFAPNEYMPFGGGVRRCLGAAFSDYETKILLSVLLRQVALKSTRGQLDKRVRRNITMGPKLGVPLRVEGLRRL